MEQHIHFLHQALDLAKKRRGFCAPNPSVGAIVVQNDKIIGTGFHEGPGYAHAERQALENISAPLEEAILYISLEPCCHYGKTPPCTEIIIQKGIKKVIYAMTDPDPRMNGLGESVLRDNKIECEQIIVPEITDFYSSYAHWTKTKKPFVTAKIAMSLDGKITNQQGEPTAITGEALQEFTHFWRKRSDAILTTSETILKDNPQMNVRIKQEVFKKPLFILDSELSFPSQAHVVQTAERVTLFYNEINNNEKKARLESLGIECIGCPSDEKGLDLSCVLEEIGKRGVHDLWVESGGRCFSSFLSENLAQRALIYVAPKFIGEGALSAFSKIDVSKFSPQQINWYSFESDVVCELNF